MNRSVMIKFKKEVEDNELMAYVLSKIASFAWVRIDMYSKENIYERPPMFCWRFTKSTSESIYEKIDNCISCFVGNVEWQMSKGSGKDGESKRNYTIEPRFIRDVYKQHGFKKMPEILEAEYKQEMQKAVEDVVSLAKYIEREFGLEDAKPIPVTIENI